jgi:hypothetical protein
MEEETSFFMDGSPGLEADPDFEKGEFSVGLKAIRIKVNVITDSGPIDNVLFRLGINVLAEIVPHGERPVLRVTRRPQRRLMVN